MALSSPSLAYLSFVQGYFDFVGLILTSIVTAWAQYQRLGLKRITHNDFPAITPDGDLSHHLCRETRERKPNAIKNVWRMAQAKGPGKVITLANGDPHVSLYPIRKVSFDVAALSKGSDPVLEWRNGSGPLKTISNRERPGALPLQIALAYGAGAGISAALEVLTNLITVFHSPRNHLVTLTLGNSDGITKCFRLFGERGDTFLADELTFSALTDTVTAQGVKWAPVKIDAGGLIPEELERILSSWSTRKQGKFPHVLYTVPCGQNPTGSTLSLERRKKIYAIAQKYDLLILEDDPYYFLQFDRTQDVDPSDERFLEKFAGSFIPSFLSLDVDGRVLRVDSFSKILAPGMRLGAITCSPLFQRYLIELTDNSTQQPAGFGQLFLTELLGEEGWTLNGFARWVKGLSQEYERRRNFLLGHFNAKIASTGYASIYKPQAGMFVWIKVHLEKHPRYIVKNNGKNKPKTNCMELIQELFVKCMDNGLAIMPAPIFLVTDDPRATAGLEGDGHLLDRVNYLRATFAGTEQTMINGLAILGETLAQFFNE
ncbi:pyridoxal phosphate-dependent transferase [Thelephora terrestris]|uniref:Pyridoxal phosphate-dependent transferase n=1 Tax=Thelephora terrestris TaxID=56493 RepID=A0A9P6LC46_9AGAM|nr:pyridoxal phosphate-dependent transferase [Thelephora terrestris]